MKIPEPTSGIAALVDKHHEATTEPPRPHMGCSSLGHPCDRWLWLSFRWVVQHKHAGRMLRLFRRGHNEEATILSDLRAVGLDIRGATGRNQVKVDLGCHVAGSLDAIIESGVPEAPNKRHIGEFKTHNLKSFNDLEKSGVEVSKPIHFVQMQAYMHGTKIDRALYLAVCKDDDRIYTERVNYDKAVAEKYIERGQRIALLDRMPEPILGASPSWYQCKLCDGYDFCHGEKITKHVNCRTCAHSTAKDDSAWRCERHDGDDIPVEFQLEGCDSHVLHPDVVPWPRKNSADQWVGVYVIDGVDVSNGEGDANIYTSREILANPKACGMDDEIVDSLRQNMGGRIVG